MTVADSSIASAYAEVGRVTRREAKNFAYGIMVLPPAKRRAIAAIYAFARRVDDVADGTLPTEEKRAQLERLDEVVSNLASRSAETIADHGGSAWAVALADSRRRFGIPLEPLHALVEGGLQDTEQSRYADFDDLRGYCEKVAGAVGLACIPVYGSDDEEHALALGIALQLINILRDVAEDWSLGRIYLPQDELARHGVSEADIGAGRVTPAWQELMALQARRARAHLDEGLRLLATLDRRSALCVSTFAELYRGQLDRIEAGGYDVFARNARLSAPAKLAVVARGLWLLAPGRRPVGGPGAAA